MRPRAGKSFRGSGPPGHQASGASLADGNPAAKVKAACAVLTLVKLPAPAPDGATDAEAILAALVRARIKANRDERDKYLSQTDRMLASMASPSKEQFEAEERAARAEVLAELEARLSEGEEPSL